MNNTTNTLLAVLIAVIGVMGIYVGGELREINTGTHILVEQSSDMRSMTSDMRDDLECQTWGGSGCE